MKTNKLIVLILSVFFSSSVFSQGITNDGAVIVIESGTAVSVSDGGGYYNLTNGSNHGTIDLDGDLYISGDFENNVTDAGQHVFTNVGSDGYVIFNGTADQTISNSTANAYIDFENLTVNNASNTVNVADGSAVTVNGDLTVTSGTFRLSSPTDGEGPTASLITNTSGSVSGTGSLYVDRHFETNNRYVYFSVPVDNATDDLFTTGYGGAFNPNLYSYDESYDATTDPDDTGYDNWSDPTYAFYNAWNQVADDLSSVPLSENAVGYVTFNNIELDIEFGGNLTVASLNNSPSYSPSVSYNLNDGNGGYYDGWNLVGNPYPCALDWDDANWIKTNISNTIYIYDGSSGNYIYYNNGSPDDHDTNNPTLNYDADGRYIPAMQAFMVKADGAPTLTIPDDARVHYSKNMYKENEDDYTETEYLMLKTEHDGFSDEMMVRFFEDATPEVDAAYDAYKMFPNSTPAMIYSLAQNPEIPVAINSLPVSDIGTSIPLGYLTEESGTFHISVEEFNFNLSTDVKFIDAYENKEYFINEDFEYSFTYDGGESRDRFYLFVAPQGTEIEENEEYTEAYSKVWSSHNKIYVTLSSYELLESKVEVFDVLGRPVIQKTLSSNYNIINVPEASGTYFVKLTTKDGNSSLDKVFIQK